MRAGVFLACLALLSVVSALNLTYPNVNIATDYFVEYDPALDANITVFNAYRINSVLAWGLPGDNAASPGGEIGYIIRYCVEVVLPRGAGKEELEQGGSNAFGSYECCNGGSCSNCGYQGSGTNPNPKMVGRSFNLDKPYFSPNMAKEYGWWYSFNNAGACGNDALGHDGCTYRASPVVEVTRLQDINILPGWTNSPSDFQQFQTINNMMVNAFDTPLASAFTYNSAANSYTPLTGKTKGDVTARCAVKCPQGMYSSNGILDAYAKNGAGGCRPCPIGTYADSFGATSCTACPAGLSTNSVGAVSVQACFSTSTPKCAPGTFNPYTGHAPCTPCATGSYQPAHSAQTCISCPPYTSSVGTGATSSSSCVLNPPEAKMLFSYSPTTTAASDIAGQILADVNGEISFLQTNSYGSNIDASGTVSLRCVETVNVSFPASSCWGSYCYNQGSAASSLPTTGTAAVYSNPNGFGSYQGSWYTFPQQGLCSNSALVGQAGCSWKPSTLLLEANLGALLNSSFYACQVENPSGYCWSQMTQEQWNNSTYILENFAKYAKLASTISTSPSTVLGPVSVQNGRCVVDCPAGYTFRSAFTTPYCVPSSSTSSSSFLASDVDVEAQNMDSTKAGHIAAIVSGSVAAVALVAIGAAIALYRIRRNSNSNGEGSALVI